MATQQESQTESTANHDNADDNETNAAAKEQNPQAEASTEISTIQIEENGAPKNVLSQSSSPAAKSNDNSNECAFWMEKPKMPKFTGDVRDQSRLQTSCGNKIRQTGCYHPAKIKFTRKTSGINQRYRPRL